MNKVVCLISFFFFLTLNVIALSKDRQSIDDVKYKVRKITKVNLLQDKKDSKVIIELTNNIETLPPVMATLETVFFDIDAVPVSGLLSSNPIDSDGFINNVKWTGDVTKTRFEIKRRYYSPVNFTKQQNPPALIVELPREYYQKESFELKPGIIRHLIRTVNDRGPVAANVLEIDLSNENISVKVGLPDKKKLKAKEKLTNIVCNEMAYAAINANYFDVKEGNPLGTLITDGQWLVGPVYDRVAIGFSQDKKVLIDQVMLVGRTTIYRGFRKKPFATFEINGLNIPHFLYNGVGLYTIIWDKELILSDDKIASIVRNGCIKKIVSDSIPIPSDGYVLVGNKDDVVNILKKRDRLKVEWQSTPDWSSVTEAVSGGPYLIMDGQIYVDELSQHFKFAKKDTFAPRSAIGIGRNGNLYLITVDGRNNAYSVGLTLKELAEFLKRLDLKDAINLDGGGSTTLVVNSEIINKLSEHHERKISSGLLIFYKD